MDKGLCIIIQPTVQSIQTIHQSLGCCPIVCLPVFKFKVMNGRKNCFFIKALLHKLCQRLSDCLFEVLFLITRGSLCHDCKKRLLVAAVIYAEYILADSLINQCLLHRRTGNRAKGKIQYLQGNIKFPVQTVSNGYRIGKVGVLLHILPLADGIFLYHPHRLFKPRFCFNLRIHIQPVKVGKICFVNICQLFCHIHISVEINIAVGGMIIGSVEIQKLLIGQHRNFLRVAAGFHPVSSMGIQRRGNFPAQKAVRVGQCSLHFIINHSVIGQLSRLIQLIMPALLAENSFILINVRIKYRIQINMHQILKILVVTACHRINCLVRICHGIQKGIQRALYQFHKGILYREIPGTAENGMFRNMRYSRGILRGGTESDIKNLVLIIIGNQRHSGTCLFVSAKTGQTMNVCYLPFFQHFICCQILYPHASSPCLILLFSH